MKRGEFRARSIAQACEFRATRRAAKSLAAALLPNLFSLAIMLGGDSLFIRRKLEREAGARISQPDVPVHRQPGASE
jgi:hypothetical protein